MSEMGPVSFEDIAVFFSEEEWKGLQEHQKELYKEVMMDNYQMLTSLGFKYKKPEIIMKIDREEDPYVNAPWQATRCRKKSSK
ncbi:zinc finger protein 92 homolog, partial [Discoglossus pictus]